MEEKSMKKSFSSLGFRFLIGTLVIYAVQMGVMTIVGAVKPEWLQDTTISLILAVLPLYLVGMPVLIAVVKRMPGEAPAKKSITPGQFVLALIMCFALMYCGNLVGTLITTVVGALKGSAVDNALMTYATGSNMIVTFLYMVICAPILEEYIFRKLIVDRTVKYGQGVAVVLSGLMFGLFHGNLNQFAYAFLLGMFLAFLYVKTGELKVTIGLHMCINFMGAVVSVLFVIESNPSGGIPGSHYERGRFTGCHGLHDEVPAGLDRLYDLCIVYSGSIGYGNRIVHCIS